MNRQLLQVGAFLEAINAPVSNYPQDHIPRELLVERRKQQEKAEEKFLDSMLAVGGGISIDPVKALAGLTTRLYVLLGDAHALGLSYLLPVAFEMVHKANIDRLWTPEQVRLKGNANHTYLPTTYKGLEFFYAVDNKGELATPPGWEPAHLSDLFESLAGQELLDFEHAARIRFGDDMLVEEVSEGEHPPGFVCIEDYEMYQLGSDDDLDLGDED